MSIAKLLLREILFRKTHFLLSLFAITVAGTLFVAGPTLIDGYSRQTDEELARMEDETRKLMRDMGFNLMIVHRDTNMSDFWAQDFSTADMPQDYVDRLARSRTLTLVTHLVATLQQKIEWNGRKVLLVGYLPEATQTHLGKKKPMGHQPEPGTAYLGHELGLGRPSGETIEVQGKTLRIARILPEQGSKEDISIITTLEDAQEILGKPGRINQILALGCRCAGERLPKVRAQLEQVLPETKVSEFRSMALARAEQRDLVSAKRGEIQETLETLAAVTTPLIVLACAVWVGLLALANVRERRLEIGVFRALGLRSSQIGALFLGKAVLLGFAGASLSVLLGSWLAHWLGVAVLEVPAEFFAPAGAVLLATALGAPLLSAMSSYLPTLLAVVQDPAVVLREE